VPSALEKVLLAASKDTVTADAGTSGVDLVAAAAGLLDELILNLAYDPDGDGDDDWGQSGKGKKANSAAAKKGGKSVPQGKKKAKGAPDEDDDDEDDDDEDTKAKKSKKKAKLTSMLAQAAAARIALAGLEAPPSGYDWVEATAVPAAYALALSADKPYGDVAYADPGYRDGKARYPLDEKHIHAALSYFSQAKNRSKYTAEQVKHIWGKIKSAARKHGVEMDKDTVAASMEALVALAAPVEAASATAMHHGPFNGQHAHPHHTMTVVTSKHHHNNDNRHGERVPYDY
jgi:hypothetical protein